MPGQTGHLSPSVHDFGRFCGWNGIIRFPSMISCVFKDGGAFQCPLSLGPAGMCFAFSRVHKPPGTSLSGPAAPFVLSGSDNEHKNTPKTCLSHGKTAR